MGMYIAPVDENGTACDQEHALSFAVLADHPDGGEPLRERFPTFAAAQAWINSLTDKFFVYVQVPCDQVVGPFESREAAAKFATAKGERSVWTWTELAENIAEFGAIPIHDAPEQTE